MEEVNSASAPSTGIKEYIVNCRQNKIPDSLIIENLRKSKWPEDIISIAIKDADAVLPSVPEQNTQETQTKTDIKAEVKQETATVKTQDDLFTKPPILIPDNQPKNDDEKKKKVFSFWAIIALLLSPIPIIGLGISMSVADYIRKNKMSGMFLVYIAILISIAVLLFILFIIYQIFTLDPGQLTGFSKYVVDTYNLLGG